MADGRTAPRSETMQSRIRRRPTVPLMARATNDNREGHAKARPTADDEFHERLAASMQRHRRILDRLAREDW